MKKGRCRRTGKDVAIKVVPKSRQSDESIRNECAVLKKVSLHKCIASLEDFYETDECFYIVMEYVSGGDVFERVAEHGAFSEPEAANLLQEMGGAVALLHAQGICHADIKPENMLLSEDGQVKLVDFGLSCEIAKAGDKSEGTVGYWAPELFKRPTPALPMDMWALGVVLYVLLAGEHPFDDQGEADAAKLQDNIRKRKPNFDCWTASTESQKLTMALLRKVTAVSPPCHRRVTAMSPFSAGPEGSDDNRAAAAAPLDRDGWRAAGQRARGKAARRRQADRVSSAHLEAARCVLRHLAAAPGGGARAG